MKVSDDKKSKKAIVDDILTSIKAFNKKQRERVVKPKNDEKENLADFMNKFKDSEDEDALSEEGDETDIQMAFKKIDQSCSEFTYKNIDDLDKE